MWKLHLPTPHTGRVRGRVPSDEVGGRASATRQGPHGVRAATWTAAWVTGPAAGGTIELVPGTWSVGRHPHASVRCHDVSLAPFEAQLDVCADGSVELTQLAGRSPANRSGQWCDHGGRLVVAADVDGPAWVELGASRLELRAAATRLDAPARRAAELDPTGDRAVVRRAPAPALTWRPAPIDVPAAVSGGGIGLGGLLPAVLTIAASVVTAMVLDQPMFLVLGLVGGAVALVGWGVQSWSGWRRARSGASAARSAMVAFETALDAQRREHAAHHAAAVGTLVEAARDVSELRAGLWAHRTGAPHGCTVAVGLGDVGWEPVLGPHAAVPPACWPTLERASVHHDAPVPVSLGERARLAVCGEHGLAAARSLVVQLAARSGPADWQLLVVSDDAAAWAWTSRLPHAALGRVVDPEGLLTLCRDPAPLAGRHTVVVTDDWAALTVRTSALRRFLALDLASAVVAVCPTPLDVPAVCTAVLDAGGGGRGRWIPDLTTSTLPVPVRCAGLHADDAEALAARLGRLIDPEDGRSSDGHLPRSCTLAPLLGSDGAVPTAEAIARAWAGADPDAPPAAPVGVAIDGVVEIDLVRDGPHALLAGTTGAGKSELLRTLVVSLAVRLSPEQLTFVLVDYKGGAAFDVCRDLPHVVGTVTDLDDRLAERALRSLRAELRRREEVLRRHAAADLTALRRQACAPVLPRLLVVIDEFAALAVEQPAFLRALVGVAQRGRSLGVHLLLATQRPHGVISDDIRANTNLRMALRLHDTADALDVLGDASPARLPRDAPGRAIMRLGPTELVEFQAAHTGERRPDGRTEAEAIVAAIAEAATLLEIPAPHRPWRAPLPREVEAAAVPDGTLGLADLPDEQVQRPVAWTPTDGDVVVVGRRGAGVTTTLRSVAHLAMRAGSDVYVIDASGDPAWDELHRHPRCGAVVRLDEAERLARLLRRFGERDVPPPGAPPGSHDAPRPLVVIDGVATLRAELDAPERSREHEALVRLVAGTSAGADAVVALGATDAVSLPSWALARCRHRWLLRVHDAHEAVALGMPARTTCHDAPGRAMTIGFVEGGEPLEVQFVRAPAPPEHGGGAPAERIGTLPATCAGDQMPPPSRTSDGWRCPVGIGFDALAAHQVVVPDGEHLVVLGPPRSGRSSALVRVVHAWLGTAGSEPWVGVLAPRRSPLRDLVLPAVHPAFDVRELLDAVPDVGHHVLLVVDDAELVDDVDGRLAVLAASRRPDVLIALAGRGDPLRAAYGHWSAAVRRSRRGILMAGCPDTDGDLLGVSLPRRSPLRPRPGLAHVVEDGELRLVQLALDDPRTATGQPRPDRVRAGEQASCLLRRRAPLPGLS